jgi:hypothetical protein
MRARSDDVTWRNVDGQVVILDLRDSCYHRTNATGALLWERLQEECTPGDLESILVESFDLDVSSASRDVAAFLEAMRSCDLLLDA